MYSDEALAKQRPRPFAIDRSLSCGLELYPRGKAIVSLQAVCMIRFGEKVIVRDGSPLDGIEGVVYHIDGEQASVLLAREVIWPVAVNQLEKADS